MSEILDTPLAGLKLLKPRVFGDNRGFFFECYRSSIMEQQGWPPMVQANVSRSQKGVLRGLHYQRIQPQAKLITVMRGEVFDVAVDIRPASPTFGQWFGTVLSDQNHLQMYIPIGFAHGFCVLSDEVDFLYQCSDYYCPEGEMGIRWDDPQLAIDWPIQHPVLSPKDEQNGLLRDIPPDRLLAGVR